MGSIAPLVETVFPYFVGHKHLLGLVITPAFKDYVAGHVFVLSKDLRPGGGMIPGEGSPAPEPKVLRLVLGSPEIMPSSYHATGYCQGDFLALWITHGCTYYLGPLRV